MGPLLAAVPILAIVIAPASSQPLPPPAMRVGPSPGQAGPSFGLTQPTPSPPAVTATNPAPLELVATFAGDARPIRSGVVWRIFADKGAGATPELVAKLTDPTPTHELKPGAYVVHAAYGLASATKRVTMNGDPVKERLAIDAGALKLSGAIGEIPIPPDRVKFSIFQPLPNDSEGKLIAADIRPGELVRLPEGTYHVVSTYGDSNAIMRSDLKVDRGKVTEATLNHRAATVTLKLVTAPGGEAFAGCVFSVLTPGGDVIREAIGSFPRVTLAEGEYVLIARHNGQVYTKEFRVESGQDGDVEVIGG